MAFASAPVTVATTATALHASDADGQSLLVSNVGAATVYLGPAGVTTSQFPLTRVGDDATNDTLAEDFAILAVILTNGG